MAVNILLIALGFALLVKGADFLVDGASGVAKRFHIPEIIIGLTIVSIGTSMPELFVSITSAIDGYSDMAIGLGKMFGFEFLENFDYPYESKSITEFWNYTAYAFCHAQKVGSRIGHFYF